VVLVATTFGTHGRFKEKYTYIKTHKSGVLKTVANDGDCRHVVTQLLFEYFINDLIKYLEI